VARYIVPSSIVAPPILRHWKKMLQWPISRSALRHFVTLAVLEELPAGVFLFLLSFAGCPQNLVFLFSSPKFARAFFIFSLL